MPTLKQRTRFQHKKKLKKTNALLPQKTFCQGLPKAMFYCEVQCFWHVPCFALKAQESANQLGALHHPPATPNSLMRSSAFPHHDGSNANKAKGDVQIKGSLLWMLNAGWGDWRRGWLMCRMLKSRGRNHAACCSAVLVLMVLLPLCMVVLTVFLVAAVVTMVVVLKLATAIVVCRDASTVHLEIEPRDLVWNKTKLLRKTHEKPCIILYLTCQKGVLIQPNMLGASWLAVRPKHSQTRTELQEWSKEWEEVSRSKKLSLKNECYIL